MPLLIEETIKGITSFNNATYQFEYLKGHPPLNNPQPQVEFLQNRIEELFGNKSVEHIDPKMGGEDFSYYLEKTKGAFVFLGSGNLEKVRISHCIAPGFSWMKMCFTGAGFVYLYCMHT